MCLRLRLRGLPQGVRLRPPACSPLSTTAMSEICPLSLNLVTQGCVESASCERVATCSHSLPFVSGAVTPFSTPPEKSQVNLKVSSPQPCCSRHVLYRNGPGVGVHCACGAESSPGHLQVWIRVSTTPLQRAVATALSREWGRDQPRLGWVK
jgi:hypothetical protein